MNPTNPLRQAPWQSRAWTFLVVVAGLAVLTAGFFLFVSARGYWQLHSTARREQQAEVEEMGNVLKEYQSQQAQELANLRDKQELQTKRVLELSQQRENRVRQRNNRIQQLHNESVQLLSKIARLPRTSREYQETIIKIQALRTEQTQHQEAEAAELNKQMRIDHLTDGAYQLQSRLLTGLGRSRKSKEYQEATNGLNSLRDEFLKLADPIDTEILSNSFSLPSYASSSNQLVQSNALMAATIKAGQSQRERINTLRLEGYEKVRSTVFSGLFFVISVAVFIATLVARWKTRPLLHHNCL